MGSSFQRPEPVKEEGIESDEDDEAGDRVRDQGSRCSLQSGLELYSAPTHQRNLTLRGAMITHPFRRREAQRG